MSEEADCSARVGGAAFLVGETVSRPGEGGFGRETSFFGAMRDTGGLIAAGAGRFATLSGAAFFAVPAAFLATFFAAAFVVCSAAFLTAFFAAGAAGFFVTLFFVAMSPWNPVKGRGCPPVGLFHASGF